MRLIDADALMPEMKFISEAEYQIYGRESWNFANKCMIAVDEAPTITVASERKTGKWLKVGGYVTPGGDPVWCCSECGKGMHVYGIEHRTYGSDISDGQWVACPNCDAKMEETEC